MKKIATILLLIISASLVCLLFSCGTTKNVSSSETIQKKDSTAVKIVVQTVKERYDSIIYVPASTTELSLGNPCDSLMHLKPVNISINKGSSQTKVWTKNDQIFISDSCGATVIKLTKLLVEKDSMNMQLKSRYVTDSKITIDKELKTTTPFWCWSVMILEGLIIVLMSFILLKTIFKI